MIIPLADRGRPPDEILEVPDRTCNLRGGVFQSRIAWVMEHAGPAAVTSLWSRLPGGIRSRPPESIEVTEWLPFAWLVALDRTITEVFGGGRVELLYELGRHSARWNFLRNAAPSSASDPAGGRRLGLNLGLSVQSHFWDARTHHGLFQDYGSCNYVPLHGQAFRLDYTGYVVRSRTFCLTGLGYFEASVRLLGGREPISEETACQCYGDPTCSYVVSWEG